MSTEDKKSPWVREFDESSVRNSLAELYEDAYSEIREQLPEIDGDIVLYFDTDPRSLNIVLSEKMDDEKAVKTIAPVARDAMNAGSGPQVLTYIDPDQQKFKTIIILRKVEEAFDPSQHERLLAAPDEFAKSLQKGNPPMSHPEGMPFWLSMYQTLGKHIHATQNQARYQSGQVTPDNIETNSFADTFAAYALFKRFGREVIPSIEHYWNLRSLYVLTSGNPQFYSTTALQIAAKDMRDTGIGMRALGLKDIIDKSEKVVADSFSHDPEIWPLQSSTDTVLAAENIKKAFIAKEVHGYLMANGYARFAQNCNQAMLSLGDLARGRNPYSPANLSI